MNLEQFEKIEVALGIKLPSEYMDLMMNYPVLDRVVDQKDLEELYLTKNLDFLIRDTKYNREHFNQEMKELEAEHLKWLHEYFVIGWDGCGNFYFLETTQSPAPILFYDHEDHSEFTIIAGDINGYLEFYKNFCDELSSS